MKQCLVPVIFVLLILGACEVDESPGPNENNPLTPEQVLEEAERQFAFTPNQNFEALYLCARANSQLAWYFLFNQDGSFDVMFTTDTHEDFTFKGAYTYSNDVINLQMQGGPTMPFPNGLNESSLLIMPQWGLVAAFATESMACVCQGHNLNEQAAPKANANYDCPNINFQAASDEDNAIELVHRAVPFEFPVLGSVFRQRDIYVNGLTNPLITRGYGIYRQTGNKFYASFRIAKDFADFSQGKLPYDLGFIEAPFEDYNVLSGTISADGQQLTVDQLDPGAGPCSLR
ncbi:MAG: hypothetical protein AAF694_10885 [Bacteroidota bacterium]